MRTKRIERLLRLIQTLELRRSLTVEELAGPVHVSRRTVFRDLVAQHARAMHAYYADEHDPAEHVEA